MGSPMMIQVDLKRTDMEMTTWVDKRPDLKVGKYISLAKGDTQLFWRIEKIYEIEIPKDHLGVRGFKNNI